MNEALREAAWVGCDPYNTADAAAKEQAIFAADLQRYGGTDELSDCVAQYHELLSRVTKLPSDEVTLGDILRSAR